MHQGGHALNPRSITLVTCSVLCDTKVAYKSFSRRGEEGVHVATLFHPSSLYTCTLAFVTMMEDVEGGRKERRKSWERHVRDDISIVNNSLRERERENEGVFFLKLNLFKRSFLDS